MIRFVLLGVALLASTACDDSGVDEADTGSPDMRIMSGDATIDAGPTDASPTDATPPTGRATLKSSRLTWTAGPAGRGGPVLNYIGEAVRLRGRLLP